MGKGLIAESGVDWCPKKHTKNPTISDPPRKDGRTASYAGQFGPDYAEKRRWMGPGDCFCRSDNAPQDGGSAGAAGAAHSRRHPAPNAGPRHLPRFSPSTTQQRKQKTIQAGPLRRHPAANSPSRPEISRS